MIDIPIYISIYIRSVIRVYLFSNYEFGRVYDYIYFYNKVTVPVASNKVI